MTLLEDYNYLGTPDGKKFRARIAASCYKAGTDTMLAIVLNLPSEQEYKARMKFTKACINATAKSIVYIAKAMISQGLKNDATDSALNTAIENNFNQLALLFDPTLEE